MTQLDRGPLTEMLFVALLRLFPSWFRDEYGQEMRESFRAGVADARHRGQLATLLFVTRAFVSVVPEALRVHRGPGPSDAGPDADRTTMSLMDDLRQAARSLVRAPAWTGVALLILTVGIGGTTAIFSLLNAVLLRPLPFNEPEELVSMWTVNLGPDLRDGSSWEDARDWLEQGSSLSDIALVFRPEFTSSTVTSFGEPERIHVGWVSSTFFPLLGVTPVLGRVFGEDDVVADARLVVIDEAFWGLRYARDPAAIGQTITMDGEEYRIVGVVPDELTIPLRETSIWRLQDVRPADGADWRGYDAYWVLGRLSPGTDVDQAQADLGRVAAGLAETYPRTNRDRGVIITSLRSEIVGDDLPLLLWTLFASTILVLLVGATNVAQLMLSRGLARTRELAIRTSLGATRARVNRQLVLESVILSCVAGIGGVLFAFVALDGLMSIVPPDVPLTEGVRIDASVLAVALFLTGVLGPLVGLLPALTASRRQVGAVLRSTGRGATASLRGARATLVVGEVAMAVILLGAAGLLARSAAQLRVVDPGYHSQETLLARVELAPVAEGASYGPVHDDVLARLEAIPGVHGAGSISQFFIERFPDQTINLVGEPPRAAGEASPRLTTDVVSPGFFEALGVPLLRGRQFEPSDRASSNAPEQVIVNQAWARTFSPDADPVGRQFRWGDRVDGDFMTVVGVVGDLRRAALEEVSYPQMFIPAADRRFFLAVRSDIGATELVGQLRAVVSEVDGGATVSDVTTAWDRYTVGLAPRRFQTLLLEAFALLGTLLAATGLFAILHESVAVRRREIGIRIALGAAPDRVRAGVFGRGLMLTGIGLAVGLAVLFALSDLTSRFVFGVGSTDPMTFIVVTGLVLSVAGVAAFLPARAATRISPSEALAGDQG